MPRYFYDLHIHSCLSPCGDMDMTPNNIVNMALIKGLDIIALTDHNSCKNCPAILQVAENTDLTVIPGMELNTLEEVHVVCLFPDLEHAMAFDEYVSQHLMQIQNKPEIFGQQVVMDAEDQPLQEEQFLLVSATDISVDSVPKLMERFGGVAFPSHVNRSSNSMIAAFGCLPAKEMGFGTVELYRPDQFYSLEVNRGMLDDYEVLINSDAHYLVDIAEPERTIDLDAADFASLKKKLGEHHN